MYIHNKRVKKNNRLFYALGYIFLVTGLYVSLLVFSPMLNYNPVFMSNNDAAFATQSLPSETEEELPGNRLLIPKLNLNVEFKHGDESVLEESAWWRYPSRGSPEDGGNFILSAHRFQLGWTPNQTRAKSPFYHINRLNDGDEISVVYEDKVYKYRVSKKFEVKPNAVEIEAPSEEHKLTLYSCTFKGESDGRTVIVAEPI